MLQFKTKYLLSKNTLKGFSCPWPALMLLLMLLPNSPAVFADDGLDWEKYEEKSGISLYRRLPQGSAFYEFKGEALFDARIEVVGVVLRDSSNYSNWMADCKKAELLSDAGDYRKIYYIHDVPWPITDRDVILEAVINIQYAKDFFEVTLSSIDDEAKSDSKYVRMSSMTGRYFVEFVNREQTRITFTIHVEPGGSLAASLSNGRLSSLAYDTLRNLKSQLQDPHYIALADKSPEKVLIEQQYELKQRRSGKTHTPMIK